MTEPRDAGSSEYVDHVELNLPVTRRVQGLTTSRGISAAEDVNSEPVKRLNLNLSEARYNRVQNLARKRGTTITDLVRFALRLVERIDAEEDDGYMIAVIDNTNQIVKEFVLPL